MIVWNMIRQVLNQHRLVWMTVSTRSLRTTQVGFAKEKKAEAEPQNEVLSELMTEFEESKRSEEEIDRLRNKSRIPERIYQQFVKKEPVPIEAKYDYKMNRLRNYYARFGKASKLNPGICWPTKEGIKEMIFYEKMFEPTLQERIRNVEEKRMAEEKEKRDYEEEVDKNMANLDKALADHHAKIEKKQTKAKELKIQREKLVEDISDYLGYEIDPKDPRFKEAVEQREKEKKKALKVKKQQESYDKMLEKLRKIAEGK